MMIQMQDEFGSENCFIDQSIPDLDGGSETPTKFDLLLNLWTLVGFHGRNIEKSSFLKISFHSINAISIQIDSLMSFNMVMDSQCFKQSNSMLKWIFSIVCPQNNLLPYTTHSILRIFVDKLQPESNHRQNMMRVNSRSSIYQLKSF